MLPQVSVVVPCRDAGHWLPACLASLCRQRGVDLELLLVDDGSCDDSQAVARRTWGDCPWPMRLLQAGGRGVSAARNLGWRAARYSLVAFLDADDLALPDRLQHQAAMFTADPDLQQVLCGWQMIDAQGRALAAVRPWEEGAGFSTKEALRQKAVLPSAWMLRREALEAVGGFDVTLQQAEDVDLLLRLSRSGQSGAWVPEVLCGYRVHEAAASRRARPQARGLSLVVERHLRQLTASPDDQRLAAEVRYGTRAWLGWYAWTCGDHPLALELWSTALGLSPFMPALTWVHLAENAVRSAARLGSPAELDVLLSSPLWERLQERWWQGRRQPRLESAPTPACGETLDWTAVQRGQVGAALAAQGPAAAGQWCRAAGPLAAIRAGGLVSGPGAPGHPAAGRAALERTAAHTHRSAQIGGEATGRPGRDPAGVGASVLGGRPPAGGAAPRAEHRRAADSGSTHRIGTPAGTDPPGRSQGPAPAGGGSTGGGSRSAAHNTSPHRLLGGLGHHP